MSNHECPPVNLNLLSSAFATFSHPLSFSHLPVFNTNSPTTSNPLCLLLWCIHRPSHYPFSPWKLTLRRRSPRTHLEATTPLSCVISFPETRRHILQEKHPQDMALEAKEVLACICRILSLSARAGYAFAQERPLGSLIASFFLLLYLFFPFVFKLLVFSIPIAFSAVTLVRVLSRDGTGSPRNPNASKDEKASHAVPPVKPNSSKEGTAGTTRQYQKPVIQAQMSKRRNFKTKREDPDAEGGGGGGVKEVKHVTFSTTCNHSLIGGDRKDQENDPSLHFGCSLDKGESSSSHESDRGDLQHVNEHSLNSESGDPKPEIEVSKDDKGGVTGQLEADIMEEAEDEDEEEAQEDGNKAVEWTEDDQKNLMDLGLSELERNRRLENLIAKRRARKLMGAKVLDNLLDLDIGPAGYILPVQILKNPFDPPNCSDQAIDSPIPGSAPSVLLPVRNPFDLPYDPQEEKPNLTVDGFQSEFFTNQPKDIFCRHESFFLGHSFSDQDLRNADPCSVTENRALREPRFSRFRRFSAKGDHDKLVEQILYRRDYGTVSSQAEHETKPENDNGWGGGLEDKQEGAEDIKLKVFKDENHAKSDSIDEGGGDQSSLSTSDDDGQATSGDGNEVLISSEFPDTAGVSVHKTSEYSVPNGIATDGDLSSPLAMDNLENRTGHSSTYSIASDMQVEVSESGSPRNIDYATSPPELECSTNSEEVEKEVTPGSEEIWGALSHLTGVEEEESKGDINNVKANKNSKDPFGSSISLVELCKEDSADGVFTTTCPKVTIPTQDPDISDSYDNTMGSDHAPEAKDLESTPLAHNLVPHQAEDSADGVFTATCLKVTVPTEGPDISNSDDSNHTMGSDHPPEAKDLESTPPAHNLVPHQAEETQSQKEEESVNPLEKSTGEANGAQRDIDASESRKEKVETSETCGES
ncbi:uncharacterized protein LOC115736630 [Rhodamnia argentea]|uniref:Uncharacterized protein LOC115736630 n=1 Tax=Rhodamnia argentea TaxID=178133 RepID=A0A8B8NQQ0_9MYRT|nr:uncharacterized protein LOC115736630 [Rhodamnia argentea]